MYSGQFKTRCVRSTKWFVFGVMLFGLIFLVAPPRETQQPILKLGFVDMTRLFNEYGRTKVLKAEFEAKRNKAQEDLQTRQAPLLELQQQLEQDSDTLPEDEKSTMQEQFKEQYANYRDYAQRTERDLRREEKKLSQDLLEELQKDVKDYGTREGYSMIFRKSLLLYGAQTYDLTDELIQYVNQ